MESELLASPINEYSIPFDKYNAPYAKYAFRIWSQNNQGLGPKPKCKVSLTTAQEKNTHYWSNNFQPAFGTACLYTNIFIVKRKV